MAAVFATLPIIIVEIIDMKRNLLLVILMACYFAGFSQNNGVLFDGNDETISIDHKPAFNIGSTYTLEAWIFANNWKPEQWRGSIVGKDGPTPDDGYVLRCGDGGRLSFVMSVNNIWNEVFTDPIMNEKQWHHVAVVIDNGNMSLYIDGNPIISSTYSGTPSSNMRDLKIASSAGFGERFFDGVIDEVRMWNTARTAAEIADNKTTSFTGTEPGLVAYFSMNEGSGTTVTNLVDAGCSGSLVNTDDSNWVEGYTIPDFDVSPSKISGLDIINLGVRPIRLNVDLQNTGSQTLTTVPLEIYVDGELALSEDYIGSIPAGANDTHTFFTPLDLTGKTDPLIEIRTTLSTDGNSLNNSTSIAVKSPVGNLIRLFDQEQHSFGGEGRTHSSSVVLPADLSVYEKLLLHISVDCPSGGCDPWDQPAKIEAITNQGTFEIARYITPYGIACGPWTVDVTDYKSVLQGAVDFRSFIQVWGNSGWLVTIDLELVEGTAAQPYSKVSKLWETDYWVYGDPGINDDLSPVSLTVDNNSESSHIRMTLSGHGQGNTNNAAEFFNATHDFVLNGAVINNHNAWKPDCESNSCSNQAGNWLFDRAGWCPGQAVDPYIVNTTSNVSAGSSIALDYELQNYTNLLNTGYNNSGHTEPHFRIHSCFVENSSNRYEDYFNLVCDKIEGEISGTAGAQTLDKMTITISNNGSQTMSNIKASYFVNDEFVVEEDVSGSLAPGESLEYEFNMLAGFTPNLYNKVYGVVSQGNDQNSGDNISKTELNPELSNTTEILNEFIAIYPNPSTGEYVNIEFGGYQFEGAVLIMDQTGKQIKSFDIRNKNFQVELPTSGLYLVEFRESSGARLVKKLIVHPR